MPLDIKLLCQNRPTNCGQTAVAMLANKTIAEVEHIYGHKSITYPDQHIDAVTKLGFYADPRGFLEYHGGKLPEVALVRLAQLKRTRTGKFTTNGKTKRSGHLVLWANNKFYDPCGREYTKEQMPKGAIIHLYLEVLVP